MLPLKQNALVLLDLIGTSDPQPTFYNTFKETDDLFQRLEQIGKTLSFSHTINVYNHTEPNLFCDAIHFNDRRQLNKNKDRGFQ